MDGTSDKTSIYLHTYTFVKPFSFVRCIYSLTNNDIDDVPQVGVLSHKET